MAKRTGGVKPSRELGENFRPTKMTLHEQPCICYVEMDGDVLPLFRITGQLTGLLVCPCVFPKRKACFA